MRRIIISESTDPTKNLALEESLLFLRPQEPWLYLWRNEPTVVIGRNQNPYLECRPEELGKRGVHIVRRLSGGGAVYHDLGNLNYTFLCPEAQLDVERQTRVIQKAVQSLGLSCVFSGRNDLLCSGRKFSGQAYYTENGCAYHHGTVMIDVDLEQMEWALTPSAVKLKTKSISSVRQRVVNLHELQSKMTVQTVARALIEQFCAEYGDAPVEVWDLDRKPPANLSRYRDSQWNLGNCPKYDAAIDVRIAPGTFQVRAQVSHGLITSASLSADALEPLDLQALEQALCGCPFLPDSIAQRLDAVIYDQ